MSTMIREHTWRQIYKNSDVEQCVNCPIQRRRTGDGWQWRPTNIALDWGGVGMPVCVESAGSETWARDETPDQQRATESLEVELKELSDRIATDPLRFQQVREELKRRRETRDEQPTPETDDERVERESRTQRDFDNNLVLKIIAMEAEQAKLVVEAELFKSQRDEAAARLALLAKVIAASGLERAVAVFNETAWLTAPAGGATLDAAAGLPATTPHLEDMRRMLEKHAKPEPPVRERLSRDAARDIVANYAGELFQFDPTLNGLTERMVDAVVEASR